MLGGFRVLPALSRVRCFTSLGFSSLITAIGVGAPPLCCCGVGMGSVGTMHRGLLWCTELPQTQTGAPW